MTSVLRKIELKLLRLKNELPNVTYLLCRLQRYLAARKTNFVLVFLLTFLIYFVYWEYIPYSEENFFKTINEDYGAVRKIGQHCSKSECFDIVDKIRHNSERWYMVREYHKAGHNTAIISTTILSTPASKTWANTDSFGWDIEKDKVETGNYYGPLMKPLFTSGAVQSVKNNTEANILLIGIGGGSIINFLSTNFPNFSITAVDIDETAIEIARAFFDVQESRNVKMIHADGVEYLKKMAENGNKVDAIILDACLNSFSNGFMCPVEGFMENKVLENTKNILSNHGVLTVNVFYRHASSILDTLKTMYKKYKKYFKNCHLNAEQNGSNLVLECHNIPSGGFEPNKKEIDSFFEAHQVERVYQTDYYY